MARSAASGRLGNRAYTTATSFNGSTTFLEKTTPVGLPTGTTSRSVSGWVWLNDPAFGLGAVAGFVTGANAPVGLIGQFGGTYYYAIDTTNASNNLTLTAAQFNAAFKLRKWHWVCYEFTNTTVTFYVDNVLVKTDAWGVAMNTGAYTALQLGKIRTNTYYFNGCMKDIRIHNGVMTAQERSNEYLFGSVSSTVVSRFLMEDGVGATTVADSVGSNTLTGTALTWQARNVPTQARREWVNQTGSPRLDGSTGYIDFGSSATYLLGTSGAFECEFYLDKQQVDTNTANSRFLLDIDNGALTNFIALIVQNTTNAALTLDCRKAGVSNTMTTVAPYGTGLMDSQWHKVACGWSAAGAWIVLDGALAALNTTDCTVTLTGTPSLVSGRLNAGINARYLTGMVRNHKLMSSATIAEAKASYVSNTPYANVVAAWDCNGIGGTVVPLTSGTGNAGTLTGGVTVVKDTPLKLRQAVNKNLVYNGNFEIEPAFTAVTTTASRWVDGMAAGSTTNDVNGWFTASGFTGTNGDVSFDTSTFQSGTASLKIAVSTAMAGTAGACAALITQISPTTANQRKYMAKVFPSTAYTLTYWVKTSSVTSAGSGGARMRVVEYNGFSTSSLAITSANYVTGTNDWQQVSIPFTTTAGSAYVNIWAQIYNETGTAWFDDIVLTPTTPVARSAA